MFHKIFETDLYTNHVHSLPHIQYFFRVVNYIWHPYCEGRE